MLSISNRNVYVQSAEFNGNAIDMVSNAYISHAQIMSGGTLSFVMGESAELYRSK